MIPSVVERYLAAINEEDWTTLLTLFTAEAEVLALGRSVARGPEAIAAHFRAAMGSLAEHRDDMTRMTGSGSLVVLEMLLTGRTADGHLLQVETLDAFELAPDRSAIVRLATWYDSSIVGQKEPD